MTIEIMLDSGAFSAEHQNTPVDIDKYCQYVKAHPQVDYYIALDVIEYDETGKNIRDKETFSNYLYMREEGLNPIPVYHYGDDPKYLQYYLKRTDYIAIGAIASLNQGLRKKSLDYIWENYLIDKEGFPVCKVHGLGMTSLPIIRDYPWYSVDSTSWVQFSRYGAILVPLFRGNKWDFSRNPNVIAVSKRSPAQSKEFFHFDTLPKTDQEIVLRYLNENGFEMGDSEVESDDFTEFNGLEHPGNKKSKVKRKETKILKPGVCNDGKLRDQVNFLYYLQLELHAPEWPWSYNNRRTIWVGK